MFTRAAAGCLVAGLCLVAASEFSTEKERTVSLEANTSLLANGDTRGNSGIASIRIASGLARPVLVTHAPGDESRIFIVEQRSGSTGRVRIYDLDSEELLSGYFLTQSVNTSSEQGLLGLAFHPDYYNGKPYVYINYTSGSQTYIKRFTAANNDPNSNSVDSGSGTTIMQFSQPYSNHNGGWIDFGPDGYLYISTGDGGSAGDPGNRSQDITNQLLGKMLRIDVDNGSPYSSPADNPFVGVTGDDEIWSYGIRNAWRCSFDKETGDLWMGDVGQYQWEEISFQPADSEGGENYGWRCYEGDHAYNTSGCDSASTMTFPVFEFNHSSGRCSVTGGYVYRGQDIPWMDGFYFFGDYCSNETWVFRYNADTDTVHDYEEITNQLSPSVDGYNIGAISSYGEDARGELYVCDLGGEVFMIIPTEPPAPEAACCFGADNSSCVNATEALCNSVNGDWYADEDCVITPDLCQQPVCPTDCNSDGITNVNDLLAIIAGWGGSSGCDPTGDGTIDVNDLLQVIAQWNVVCE
ncbi:MAG: sugar dehydrogenase [Phycisphaerae bacterium]|nr:sugar dehydrogenase [Phycisphaerae bacterium]